MHLVVVVSTVVLNCRNIPYKALSVLFLYAKMSTLQKRFWILVSNTCEFILNFENQLIFVVVEYRPSNYQSNLFENNLSLVSQKCDNKKQTHALTATVKLMKNTLSDKALLNSTNYTREL